MMINIRAGEVPELIRKTAEGIAGAFYDGARTDEFRNKAPNQNAFVRNHWKHYVSEAIDQLTTLLAMPGTPDEQKRLIHEAITTFHNRSTEATPAPSIRRLQ